MPGNVDYILGGAQTLAGGAGDLLKRREQDASLNRELHPAIQTYMQAVLRGEMDPQEAAIRAKLEMGGHLASSGTGQPQAPQAEPFRGVPPSLLTPSLLASAKPTLPPAGDLMSGGPAMSQASGGAAPAPQQPSLLQPPTPAPSRLFTVRDLGDMEKLGPFYQSQMATRRMEESRRSVEAEGAKSRQGSMDRVITKMGGDAKKTADLIAQRDRAARLNFTARMAAIKAMERNVKSRRANLKDILTFKEEGANLRAEKANIARLMAATAQSLNTSSSAVILQEATRRLQELQKLEEAYAPIRQHMLEISGLDEDTFTRKFETDEDLLAPLTEESETYERSTPAGLKP